MGESYLSAEVQSVYSTTPADGAKYYLEQFDFLMLDIWTIGVDWDIWVSSLSRSYKVIFFISISFFGWNISMICDIIYVKSIPLGAFIFYFVITRLFWVIIVILV